MSKKRKTPLYLYSSDFSISGLQVAEILLQKNFPCWRKKKRGKDYFFFKFCFTLFWFCLFFGNSAPARFVWIFFFDETDLCGYEIFNRFLLSDSHEDIDYSSFPTFSLFVLLHTTQFLFRDFCFWSFTLFLFNFFWGTVSGFN